jgi:hypothetical protein
MARRDTTCVYYRAPSALRLYPASSPTEHCPKPCFIWLQKGQNRAFSGLKHYPRPKSQGGKETFYLCANCHAAHQSKPE